jgi:acyl-coenzyme A synthetase/AMP-(fatty) acid ligase
METKNSFYNVWEAENAKNLEGIATDYFASTRTFAVTAEKVDNYARSFQDLGLNQGSTVAFCMPLIPTTIEMSLALNKLGVKQCFMSSDHFARAGKALLEDAGAETLVVMDVFYGDVEERISESSLKNVIVGSFLDDASSSSVTDIINNIKMRDPSLTKVPSFFVQASLKGRYKNITKKNSIVGKAFISQKEFLAKTESSKDPVQSVYNPDAPAVRLFSEDGSPVEYTNEEILERVSKFEDIVKNSGVTGGDRFLCLNPPYTETVFMFGLVAPTLFGCTQIIQPFYNKETFADNLVKMSTSVAFAPVEHCAMLADAELGSTDLTNLKLLGTGEDSIDEGTKGDIEKALESAGCKNPHMLVAYGL